MSGLPLVVPVEVPPFALALEFRRMLVAMIGAAAVVAGLPWLGTLMARQPRAVGLAAFVCT